MEPNWFIAFRLTDSPSLKRFFATVPAGAGCRLSEAASFAFIVEPLHEIVQDLIGPKARAVRATAFDTMSNIEASRNWSLGWHQDRTICVQDRHGMPGYERRTRKHGKPMANRPSA